MAACHLYIKWWIFATDHWRCTSVLCICPFSVGLHVQSFSVVCLWLFWFIQAPEFMASVAGLFSLDHAQKVLVPARNVIPLMYKRCVMFVSEDSERRYKWPVIITVGVPASKARHRGSTPLPSGLWPLIQEGWSHWVIWPDWGQFLCLSHPTVLAKALCSRADWASCSSGQILLPWYLVNGLEQSRWNFTGKIHY